jgi:hypothetical protein
MALSMKMIEVQESQRNGIDGFKGEFRETCENTEAKLQ